MHDLKRTDAPLVLYVHGQGGSAREAEHYRPLFPGKDVLGLDYQAETPWDFIREVRPQVQRLTEERGPLTLIANSIGAYFSMSALSNQSVQRAFFISPVVDMERLITEMTDIARKEIENAERTIPLVEADSRLGWEPSMEYIGDARHIRWKIRQVTQLIEQELPEYRKVIHAQDANPN